MTVPAAIPVRYEPPQALPVRYLPGVGLPAPVGPAVLSPYLPPSYYPDVIPVYYLPGLVSGIRPPTPADLIVRDNADGSGGKATVSNSDPTALNEIYRAVLPGPTGEVLWFLAGSVVGNGETPVAAGPGNWLWQVRTTEAGLTTVGATYYQPTTGLPYGPYQIFDNADSTGLTVWINFGLPDDSHSVEIKATNSDTWVAAGSRTGPGYVTVPVDDAGLTLVRAHEVRVATTPAAGTTRYTETSLQIATNGCISDLYGVMLEIVRRLLALDLPDINGSVYWCIDPDGAIAQVTQYPALFVYRQTGEKRGNQDNRTTSWVADWNIRIVNRSSPDRIEVSEWYECVRQRIIDAFDRRQFPKGGRKWTVTPGTVFGRPDAQYDFLASELVLSTDVERKIGGN
jgi:hypothetical protein